MDSFFHEPPPLEDSREGEYEEDWIDDEGESERDEEGEEETVDEALPPPAPRKPSYDKSGRDYRYR